MALVGLMESLMTAKLVDDITDTHSTKTREAWGQGVANIVTGFFGGMGGCAMIGQTMINVKVSGARTRMSTFLAGVFLLILVVGPRRRRRPDPDGRAGRGDDHGVGRQRSTGTASRPATLRRMPLQRDAVMVVTVVVTVATHNLAIGVVVGVLIAMVFFARRVAHFTEVVDVAAPRRRTPASTPSRASCSSPPATTSSTSSTTPAIPNNVIIDLTDSQI